MTDLYYKVIRFVKRIIFVPIGKYKKYKELQNVT